MQWLGLLYCFLFVVSTSVRGVSLNERVLRPVSTCSSFPAPAPDTPSNLAEVVYAPGNNGTDESTDWELPAIASLNGRSQLERRGVDGWQEAVDKGKALWQLLSQTLNDRNAQDAQVCGLDDRWDVDKKSAHFTQLNLRWMLILRRVIPSTLLRTTAMPFYEVDITAPKGVSLPPFSYVNSYAPSLGIIEASDIQGVHRQKPSIRAPDRWSDVTWQFWRVICKSLHIDDPSRLWLVLQSSVENPTTRATQDEIIKRKYGHTFTVASDWLLPRDDDLFPGSDDFYALLSSPNVIGTVYMLIRNVNAIGRKTIKRIGCHRSAPGHMYYLFIELEKATLGASQANAEAA